MVFMQGCSHFTIRDSQLTNVQGSQHITHIHKYREEKRPTIWQEYKQLRTCNLYVTRIVGDTVVRRDDDKTWRKVDARRLIAHANRVAGQDKETEFLRVEYSGSDAFEAFKLDFEQFSRIKHPHVAQLFGYNCNRQGLPALIFYDA
ncbi:hypothetical protein MPER_05484 [Moniliophthora perniciosa FA553]|nr:hypothetical protein MPER_05484 [Moniliophthora perniciosa FA553]